MRGRMACKYAVTRNKTFYAGARGAWTSRLRVVRIITLCTLDSEGRTKCQMALTGEPDAGRCPVYPDALEK